MIMMGVLCHPLQYACHPIPLKGLITKFTNSLTDKQYNYIRLSPNGIICVGGTTVVDRIKVHQPAVDVLDELTPA